MKDWPILSFEYPVRRCVTNYSTKQKIKIGDPVALYKDGYVYKCQKNWGALGYAVEDSINGKVLVSRGGI